MLRYIILSLILFLATITAQADQRYAFIDIDSNVANTPIFLNGQKIGNTPIKAFKIKVGTDLKITAQADKNYYEDDITKTVLIGANTQKRVFFKFNKAKAKVLFIGDHAHLFINNKFIKELNEENRITTIDAGKNIEIYLEDKYKTRTLFKDIKANQFYTIKYTLVYIPKEIRLFTTTVENLMWEDTKHASTTKINWIEAKRYCKNLQFAGVSGWKLPSLEQLTRLEQKYKNKIYHKFGKTFYWSDTSTKGKYEIWDYVRAVNFYTGDIVTPVSEVASGYVRCVKELGNTTKITITQEQKQQLKKRASALGYDPSLTKNLQRYMLK